MGSRIVWPKCAICRHCADCAPVGSRQTCPAAMGRRRQGECQSGRSGLRPSLVRGDTPRNAPLKTRPHSARCSQYPIIAAWRPLPTTKGFFRGPPWTDQIIAMQRFSSWPFVDRTNHDHPKVFFVVLRGPSWTKRRCSPLPSVERPNHDPAQVFFVVLRGPSWINQILVLQFAVQTNVNEP